jgi:hypothetical protein
LMVKNDRYIVILVRKERNDVHFYLCTMLVLELVLKGTRVE